MEINNNSAGNERPSAEDKAPMPLWQWILLHFIVYPIVVVLSLGCIAMGILLVPILLLATIAWATPIVINFGVSVLLTGLLLWISRWTTTGSTTQSDAATGFSRRSHILDPDTSTLEAGANSVEMSNAEPSGTHPSTNTTNDYPSIRYKYIWKTWLSSVMGSGMPQTEIEAYIWSLNVLVPIMVQMFFFMYLVHLMENTSSIDEENDPETQKNGRAGLSGIFELSLREFLVGLALIVGLITLETMFFLVYTVGKFCAEKCQRRDLKRFFQVVQDEN